MTKTAFDKIAAALTEAVAIAKGKADDATYQAHLIGRSEPKRDRTESGHRPP